MTGYSLRQVSCSNLALNYQSVLRLNDFVNGKILKRPYGKPTQLPSDSRSRQSTKAIVQVEVEAIAEVIVNAWPFQWRQVDT